MAENINSPPKKTDLRFDEWLFKFWAKYQFTRDLANAIGILGVGNGGTGLSDIPSNGELLIGNGTGYTQATLTAGTGITITNGAGSITIESSGGSNADIYAFCCGTRMIRLTSATRKLQALLSGAVTTNQLPITVSYSDKTASTYDGGTQLTNTNNTTPVDICAAPGASTVRDIDYISAYNRDTVAQALSIIYDDNGADYVICSVSLDAGDQLQYIHGQGWHTQDVDGKIKSTGGGSGSSLPVVDTTSIVEGSLDPSKEMRFEVDQNTGSQVRVMYVPDYDWQMGYPRNLAIADFTIPADTSYIVANSFDDGGFVVTIEGTLGII